MTKINYFDLKLFRKNIPVLLGLFLFCLVLASVSIFNASQIQVNRNEINGIIADLEEYTAKKNLLDLKSQVIDSQFDLDLANRTLTQLIPVKEDFFSILAALESLSAKTNFVITPYNIIVNDKVPDRLSIEIEGEGNPQTFLEFLREYNFAGGRLITIDNIDFSQESFTGTKVDIYVYNGKVSGGPDTADISGNVDLELIKTILAKVEINLKTEENVEAEYPTKSNPF